jgi:hypothetical protein
MNKWDALCTWDAVRYTRRFAWLRAIKREARRKALGSARVTCPVRLVPGDCRPSVRGMPGHYRTRGGTIIKHPSAYSKKGWSNVVYHPSTLRVVAGVEWRPDNRRP